MFTNFTTVGGDPFSLSYYQELAVIIAIVLNKDIVLVSRLDYVNSPYPGNVFRSLPVCHN